jgi:hypothetical protein
MISSKSDVICVTDGFGKEGSSPASGNGNITCSLANHQLFLLGRNKVCSDVSQAGILKTRASGLEDRLRASGGRPSADPETAQVGCVI